MACNYNSNATLEDSTCTYAQLGYDCDSNCVAVNIDWIGDQDGNGYTSIDPATGDLYITIESFPNVGSAMITINGETLPMEYTDWGANAHWYYSMTTQPNTDYNWNMTVSNGCAVSQSYEDAFSTDCANIANGISEDLGCGCGEPAALFGYDCDGNCLVDVDCAGVCGGTSVLDECGVCDGDNSSCTDDCGVVNGDNSSIEKV